MGLFIVLVLGLAFVVYDRYTFNREHQRLLDKPWVELATGEYASVEYGHRMVAQHRQGKRMRPTDRRVDQTIVYFSDGRTCVMSGNHSMPFPCGKHIRILRHLWYGHRIEAVD